MIQYKPDVYCNLFLLSPTNPESSQGERPKPFYFTFISIYFTLAGRRGRGGGGGAQAGRALSAPARGG
jgi:hypothetical protein